MDEYMKFCKAYPLQKAEIDGKTFPYRYHRHESAQVTVVLLVGGLGLSDLMFMHFEKFAKHFSVLTFDYSQNFENNEELTAAICELLKTLDIKAWFVGQSLGGFVAQLMAEKYPQVCEGLVLSNTGCTSETMSKTAYNSLMGMLESTKKNKKLFKSMPFSLLKKQISKKIVKKYAADFSKEEKIILRNLTEIMEKELTKEYELHMLDLLMDLQNHFGAKKENFAYLNDRVLLILSDDDKTFHDEVKAALVELMPNPTIKTDLKGGHLSLLVHCDEYVEVIVNYIAQKQ